MFLPAVWATVVCISKASLHLAAAAPDASRYDCLQQRGRSMHVFFLIIADLLFDWNQIRYASQALAVTLQGSI